MGKKQKCLEVPKDLHLGKSLEGLNDLHLELDGVTDHWCTRLEGNPICSKVRASYCGNEKNTHILLISVIVPVVSLLVVLCILWKLCWKGKTED